MKYQWTEENITCESLSKELGIPVTSVTVGDIITGYTEQIDKDGKVRKNPIVAKGIEVEVDGETKEETLAVIDKKFPHLKRKELKGQSKGGRTK